MHDENGPMSWTDGVEGCDFQVRSRGSVMLHLFCCCVFRKKNSSDRALLKKTFYRSCYRYKDSSSPQYKEKISSLDPFYVLEGVDCTRTPTCVTEVGDKVELPEWFTAEAAGKRAFSHFDIL